MPLSLPTVGAYNSIALAALGADIITDTTQVDGDWAIIYPLTDAVFNTLTGSGFQVNGVAETALATAVGTLAAGIPIYGRFSRIKLTSGRVFAIRATQRDT